MTHVNVTDHENLMDALTIILISSKALADGSKFTAFAKNIRYTAWAIQNFNTCLKLGQTPSIDDQHYLPMSEKFYDEWVADKNVKCVGEHKTPLNIIVKDLINMKLNYRSIDDLQTAYEYLSEHLLIALITQEEDEFLKVVGLLSEVPDDGSCRYEAAGIKLLSTPIEKTAKNWKKLQDTEK